MICLKNRTFAVSQTTYGDVNPISKQLWFAWKIVLLQYRKQQLVLWLSRISSCDLLEKSYFCSIANNIQLLAARGRVVVICLKNRTFAVSQTTWPWQRTASARLWFAWKIVLLQYRKQQLGKKLVRRVSCDLLEKSYFCSIANNFIISL